MSPRSANGQALPLTALALFVLLGVVGMAIDMGVMRYNKRLQQTAADAAAIAGAADLNFGGVATAALSAAQAEGFADTGTYCNSSTSTCPSSGGVGYVAVTVNWSGSSCGGPCSGPHQGDPDYVEVLVSDVHPTLFMSLLGAHSETIVARAVATNLSGGPDTGCIYSLGLPSSQIQGINLTGQTTLTAVNCGIVDNGNYNTQGSSLTVSAATFGMAGDRYSTGNGGSVTCTATPTSCPTPNMPVAADPLGGVPAPSEPAASTSCSLDTSGACNVSVGSNTTATLYPGTYTSISIGGGANVTFEPGLYYIDDPSSTLGLYINGTGSGKSDTIVSMGTSGTTGWDGVTFYFTGEATVDSVGGGNHVDLNLTAPTTGTYAGILFFQSRTDTSGPTLGGDNNTQFNGALYFPDAQLTFYGNSTSYTTGIVVADSIALSGNPNVTVDYPTPGGTGVNPIKNAVLVQ